MRALIRELSLGHQRRRKYQALPRTLFAPPVRLKCSDPTTQPLNPVLGRRHVVPRKENPGIGPLEPLPTLMGLAVRKQAELILHVLKALVALAQAVLLFQVVRGRGPPPPRGGGGTGGFDLGTTLVLERGSLLSERGASEGEAGVPLEVLGDLVGQVPQPVVDVVLDGQGLGVGVLGGGDIGGGIGRGHEGLEAG